MAPADVELERLEAPRERVPDPAVRIGRREPAVERRDELLGADDRHRHLGAAVGRLRVLFEREVGLAEEQPAVQALVDLLMPVLEQREDLLGRGVVGAVRRDRVAPVAPAAASDQPHGGERDGDEQPGQQRERHDAGDVGDREQERLLERLERGVRIAVAVTVGGRCGAGRRSRATARGRRASRRRAGRPATSGSAAAARLAEGRRAVAAAGMEKELTRGGEPDAGSSGSRCRRAGRRPVKLRAGAPLESATLPAAGGAAAAAQFTVLQAQLTVIVARPA